MPSAPLDLSEQTRAVHTVLGLLLLVYGGFGSTSSEFFATAEAGAQSDPVSWFMLSAMLCGVVVLAAVCAQSDQDECGRRRLQRECALLFQSIGWVLFFSAALIHINKCVLVSA